MPIEQARILQRRVDAAGRHRLLVQRVFRDPGHSGFTDTEWAASLDALVGWVERDVRPAGNNVLVPDWNDLRARFELNPRPGTPEADRFRGRGVVSCCTASSRSTARRSTPDGWVRSFGERTD